MSARTSLACDSCGLPYVESSVRTATDLRTEAAGQGWHVQPGGNDVCPSCWDQRVRFRIRHDIPRLHGGRVVISESYILPTGWGNGRARS